MCFLKGRWGELRLTILTVNGNLRPNLSWAVSWGVTSSPGPWPLTPLEHPLHYVQRDRSRKKRRVTDLLNTSTLCILTSKPCVHTRQCHRFKNHKEQIWFFLSWVLVVFLTVYTASLYSVTEERLWARWLDLRLQVAACPPLDNRLAGLHHCLPLRSALDHAVEQCQPPKKSPSI